jgi:hypothetical protein
MYWKISGMEANLVVQGLIRIILLHLVTLRISQLQVQSTSL